MAATTLGIVWFSGGTEATAGDCARDTRLDNTNPTASETAGSVALYVRYSKCMYVLRLRAYSVGTVGTLGIGMDRRRRAGIVCCKHRPPRALRREKKGSKKKKRKRKKKKKSAIETREAEV